MRAVFQTTIVDDTGNVVPSCNIEVRLESSGDLVQVFDSIDGEGMLGNPFATDEDGFTRFYLPPDSYRIRAYLGAFERIWRHVLIGVGISDTWDQDITVGITTAPATRTFYHTRVDDLVTVFMPAFQGTSDSTSLIGSGDMPESIRPAVSRACGGIRVVDNGAFELGSVVIATNGQLTFWRGAQTAWTDSGTKGWLDSCFTYRR